MSEKIKCPHCGEETSTVYTHCEKCNMPLSKNASGAGIFRFITVVLAILGIIATIVTYSSIGLSSFIYLVGGCISAALMYGIERIIDLLYQIKCNTDKK